jgi:hypothetical protein
MVVRNELKWMYNKYVVNELKVQLGNLPQVLHKITKKTQYRETESLLLHNANTSSAKLLI